MLKKYDEVRIMLKHLNEGLGSDELHSNRLKFLERSILN